MTEATGKAAFNNLDHLITKVQQRDLSNQFMQTVIREKCKGFYRNLIGKNNGSNKETTASPGSARDPAITAHQPHVLFFEKLSQRLSGSYDIVSDGSKEEDANAKKEER